MLRWMILAACLALIGLWGLSSLEPAVEQDPDARSRNNPMDFLSASSGGNFTPVVAGKAIEFPRDHGAHPDFRQEWWYFTGRLESVDGRVFGYQLTFFRFATGDSATKPVSAWSADQSWMAHLAITDTAGKRFMAAEDFSRGALGLAGAQAEPLALWVNGWSVRSAGQSGHCAGCFTARLNAGNENMALELTLQAVLPPVLQGEDGFSVKSEDGLAASYYYSMPGIVTHGVMRIGDRTVSVRGESWMDREWSTEILKSEYSGWDWFSINLDNGYRLMIFQIRASGQVANLQATLIGPGNHRLPFDPDLIRMEPVRFWSNARKDASWPVVWNMQGDSPHGKWALTVSPALDDQEMNLTFRYYEGLVEVEGVWSGAPVSGWGYMELTGYAR